MYRAGKALKLSLGILFIYLWITIFGTLISNLLFKCTHVAKRNATIKQEQLDINLENTHNSLFRSNQSQRSHNFTSGYDVISPDDNFTRCYNTIRPEEGDITRKDHKWQYFRYGNKTFYYQAVYYDNREGQFNLKVFPIVGVPLGDVAMDSDVKALLWYEGLQYPISTQIVQIQYQYKEKRYTNGTNYGNAFQIIPLPSKSFTKQQTVPLFVSFSKTHCPEKPETYVNVVLPMPVTASPEGILVCPKSLYGTLTNQSIPHFVNWFEFLKLFGVTTVHMSYSGLRIQDAQMRSVFDYYIESGLLSYFQYSPDNLFAEDIHEVDTVAMSNMNDCFFRNLNRYKYVLHQDTDELFIPRQFQTYYEAVESFINKTLMKTGHAQNYSCFRVYAALHYTFHPAGNPEQPEYMPILRYTLRQPTSIWGENAKNPGGTKTIGIMANIIKIDAHSMRAADSARGPIRVQEKDMLVHHYRGNCRRQGPEQCALEINDAFKDDLIVSNYAAAITPRVERVLSQLGYFNSN